MMTPGAKRRRTDAASTLRRPFRSPLINRPLQDGSIPPGTSLAASPPGQAQQRRRHASGLRNTRLSEDNPPVPAARAHDASGAVDRGAGRDWSQDVGLCGSQGEMMTGTRARPLHTISSDARQVVPHTADSSGGLDSPDKFPAAISPPQLHSHTPGTSRARDVPEVAPTTRHKGQSGAAVDGDAELRVLIARWKGASRLAAEEVFSFVKERVDNAGGLKALKEGQRRQQEFFRGLDAAPASASYGGGPVSDDGGGKGGEHYPPDGSRDSLDDPRDGGEDDSMFTMGTMLRGLNIDTGILGFDENGESWID